MLAESEEKYVGNPINSINLIKRLGVRKYIVASIQTEMCIFRKKKILRKKGRTKVWEKKIDINHLKKKCI